MDQALFSCLRTDAPAQDLHPNISPLPVTLHDRSSYASHLDLPTSSPSNGYLNGEDNGSFASPDHLPQKQHPLHPQLPLDWTVPLQVPMPHTLHSICAQLDKASAPELCVTCPKLCDTNASHHSSEPTVASSLSGKYGQHGMCTEDPDRQRSNGKNRTSGKNRNPMITFNQYTEDLYKEVIEILFQLQMALKKSTKSNDNGRILIVNLVIKYLEKHFFFVSHKTLTVILIMVTKIWF